MLNRAHRDIRVSKFQSKRASPRKPREAKNSGRISARNSSIAAFYLELVDYKDPEDFYRGSLITRLSRKRSGNAKVAAEPMGKIRDLSRIPEMRLSHRGGYCASPSAQSCKIHKELSYRV